MNDGSSQVPANAAFSGSQNPNMSMQHEDLSVASNIAQNDNTHHVPEVD